MIPARATAAGGRRWVIRTISAGIVLAAGIAITPSFILAFAGLFAFDAPDSFTRIDPYLIAGICFSAPVLIAAAGLLSIASIVLPDWRLTGSALFCLAVPAVFCCWMFDPLHLRHYPPGQVCDLHEDRPAGQQRVCRPFP